RSLHVAVVDRALSKNVATNGIVSDFSGRAPSHLFLAVFLGKMAFISDHMRLCRVGVTIRGSLLALQECKHEHGKSKQWTTGQRTLSCQPKSPAFSKTRRFW